MTQKPTLLILAPEVGRDEINHYFRGLLGAVDVATGDDPEASNHRTTSTTTLQSSRTQARSVVSAVAPRIASSVMASPSRVAATRP